MAKTRLKSRPVPELKKQRKRRQLVLTPRVVVQTLLSDASTIPMDVSGDVSDVPVQAREGDTTANQSLLEGMEEAGEIVSDSDSLTDLSDEEDGRKETDALRNDMAINRDRWSPEEVDALFTAVNINRDAIKFHFAGPGGGKDVKRQGWRDVAGYVNDTENTHRTVKQCRNKAADYSQRVKGKFNRLRFAVSQTGKGKIKKGLHLKFTEGKALDYLRREAVKGIPGITPMPLPEFKKKKPSQENAALIWEPDRPTKPDYDGIEMKREGVPKNYTAKNKRRLTREQRQKRSKDNAKQMKADRKNERAEAREIKRQKQLDRKEARKARKADKKKAEKKAEGKRKRKEKKERERRKEYERKREQREKKVKNKKNKRVRDKIAEKKKDPKRVKKNKGGKSSMCHK